MRIMLEHRPRPLPPRRDLGFFPGVLANSTPLPGSIRPHPSAIDLHARDLDRRLVRGRQLATRLQHRVVLALREPLRSDLLRGVIRRTSLALILSPANLSNTRAAFAPDSLPAPANTIRSMTVGRYSR